MFAAPIVAAIVAVIVALLIVPPLIAGRRAPRDYSCGGCSW